MLFNGKSKPDPDFDFFHEYRELPEKIQTSYTTAAYMIK